MQLGQSSMHCLLCDRSGAALSRSRELWTTTCSRCGEYRWSDDFGMLVWHARTKQVASVERQLARLAVTAARGEVTMPLTAASYARHLADGRKRRPHVPSASSDSG